jgi:replicative DNA helicase
MTSLSEEILRETLWAPLDLESPDEMVAERLQPADAVPTPFPSWNAVCRDEGAGKGLARGWHITVAAATGKGKSLIGANLVRRAVEAGERVGYISLEMSQRQLDTRQLAIVSGVPVRELEPGRSFSEASLRRAMDRVKAIHRDRGGRIFRSPDLLRGIADIEGAINFLKYGPPGCRYFIIDYLQLAGDPNDPASITDVSHRVRQCARDMDVVTIGLSQFNRDTFRRGGRPTIHDLMGGSAIENDSDQVVILDHTRSERAPAPAEGWDSYPLVEKNRHGPNVEIPVRFDTSTLRWSELLADELPSLAVAR